MKVESVKNINITLLLSSPLNHLLISQKDLLDKFKSGVDDNDKHSFIEAPGLKVLVFPKRQKEIVFEANRIVINDKRGGKIDESEVVDDLQNLLTLDAIDLNKLSAYGFNYDAVIIPESDSFDINNLVGSKIASIENIKSAGVNVLFEKGNITYVLEIKPLRDNKRFIAHFNAHFNLNKLPSAADLKSEINLQFNEFNKILQNI